MYHCIPYLHFLYILVCREPQNIQHFTTLGAEDGVKWSGCLIRCQDALPPCPPLGAELQLAFDSFLGSKCPSHLIRWQKLYNLYISLSHMGSECCCNVFYKSTAVWVTYLKWDFEVVFLLLNVLMQGYTRFIC